MKQFTKVWGLTISMFVSFYFVHPCFSQEGATKEECVAKVEEAAELVTKIGLTPALEKIMDQNSSYKWKDSCVFCMEEGMGKLLAHPISPRFIGFPMKNFKDADGKQPFVKVLEEIDTKNKGWVEYYLRPQGVEEPKLKKTYFLKIPGENAIFCAGYYE